MQNKGKLTIMKYFRACVGSFLVMYHLSLTTTCADPESEVSEGQTLTTFFLV